MAEWRAYYTVEPFGQEWHQAADTMAMIGNAAGGKKGGRAFKPDEFLPAKPSIRQSMKEQTPEQMLSIFKLMSVQSK